MKSLSLSPFMTNQIKRPIVLFAIMASAMMLIFFLTPIQMFDGEVIYIKEGGEEVLLEGKLSLSYFIGIGYSPSDMANVKDFYLTTQGYVLAFLIIIGFPALLSYRLSLRQNKE